MIWSEAGERLDMKQQSADQYGRMKTMESETKIQKLFQTTSFTILKLSKRLKNTRS